MSAVSISVVENNPIITVSNTDVNVDITENLVKVVDAPYMKYGAFEYIGSQQSAGTANALAMPFNTTDYSSDAYIANTSRIYFPTAGTYNIQWSGQFQNSDNAQNDIYVWLRINGTDVVGSTGYISVSARKSVNEPGHAIVGWNYFLTFTAGQYLELMWSSSSDLLSVESYVAGINPTRPSTAALILTATQIA